MDQIFHPDKNKSGKQVYLTLQACLLSLRILTQMDLNLTIMRKSFDAKNLDF